MASTPIAEDLQPLLDTQQNQLGFVSSDGASIDSRALAILATNVALLIFIEQSVHTSNPVALAGLLLPFLVSLAFNVFAVWPRHYAGASINLHAHPEYLTMASDDLMLQLLADTADAIKTNSELNKRRWRYCLVSLACTAIGTAILLLYFH